MVLGDDKMRITVECDYALRIILYLAGLKEGCKADSATIAEVQKIPQRFNIKIMRKLTMAGIIKSYKGVKGGYALAKPPAEITLLDVVEVIDGDINLNKCMNDSCDCTRIEKRQCPIHKELADINEYINQRLKSINFEYLLKTGGEKK